MATERLRARPPALTDRIVERAKPAGEAPGGKGVYFIRDGSTPGFAIRVTETGSKAFVFEARFKGRTRRVMLGPYPALSTAAARKMAHQKRAELVAGVDPGEQRRAARNEITLRELVAMWMDGDIRKKGPARAHKRTWREDERQIESFLGPWFSRKLSDISIADVAELHARVGRENGIYVANRLLALLKAMLRAAERRRLVSGPLPTDSVASYEEKKRERLLTTAELRRLLRAIVEESDAAWRGFFLLALLLGQRRTELLSARWADIDCEAGRWLIPHTKAGRPHVLPLTPDVVAVLVQIPREADAEYVFASESRDGHLVEPKRAWKRILARAKVEDLRIHDLRHAHASLQASGGVSLLLVARILGHSQISTTQRYAHLALDPMRKALEDNSRRVLALLEQKTGEGQADADAVEPVLEGSPADASD